MIKSGQKECDAPPDKRNSSRLTDLMVATTILELVLARGKRGMRWLGVGVGQKSVGGWWISYCRRADVRPGRVLAVVGYGLLLLTRVDKER